MECEPIKEWCRPGVKGVVLRFVRRLANTLLVIPLCGVWYRKLLGRFDQLICLLTCDGGMITDYVHVTDALTMIRGYEKLAKHTIVINHGLGRIKLYEMDLLVAVLWPTQQWDSPLSGKFQLNAICDTGEQSDVTVTTYKRCDCGVDVDYYYLEIEPIGGKLI